MFAGYLWTAALHDDVGQVQTELGGYILQPAPQQSNDDDCQLLPGQSFTG